MKKRILSKEIIKNGVQTFRRSSENCRGEIYTQAIYKYEGKTYAFDFINDEIIYRREIEK